MQDEFIVQKVKNLPVFHAASDLTQNQFGTKLSVSRQTIVAIENGKPSDMEFMFSDGLCVWNIFRIKRFDRKIGVVFAKSYCHYKLVVIT